jgi:hypothetical protein
LPQHSGWAKFEVVAKITSQIVEFTIDFRDRSGKSVIFADYKVAP